VPQYATTTLTSAIQQLSARLNDSANIQWAQAEVQNAIVESLRIFQALTGFYRERIPLNTVANQIFYDLRTTNPIQYAFTVTDNQLLSEIQYHLKEPATNPWTGSAQFNIPVIASALQRARDQFLADTGIYCTRSLQNAAPPPIGRIQLPQTLLDIRRAAWQDSSTLLTFGLPRVDEYAARGYSQPWPQNPRLPDGYSVALTPPVSMQLIPAPSNAGTLDLCILSSGPVLICDPTNPVIVGLPDDYCWGAKYGALADLLGEDGPAADMARSAYCRQLYRLALSLGKKPITLLQAEIQDILVTIGSIEDYDRRKTNWQNVTATTPTDVLQVAPNLFALGPAPDIIYTITMDLVRSMPVPVAGTDFLQVSQDLLEAILDMAHHIACLKQAGEEFQATLPLRDNFLRLAAAMNARLRANIFYNILLDQPATRQDSQVPRLMEVQT
jgi:hypothetical protein